jgi:site-specific DNA recombinase
MTIISNYEYRVVIYLRRSKKNSENMSIEDQNYAIKKEIDRRGWKIVAPPYIDIDSAQTVDNLKNFNRMCEDAKKGLFDIIIVWDLNRFNRYPDDPIKFELLKYYQVQIFSLSAPVEPDHPDKINLYRDDRAMVQGMGNINSHIQINEMVRKFRRGLEGKVRSGRVAKPKNKRFGYTYKHEEVNERGVDYIAPDEKEGKIVPIIFDLYVFKGFGDRKVAAELNEMGIPTKNRSKWQAGTVRGILTNRLYCGYTEWGKTITRKKIKGSNGRDKNLRRETDIDERTISKIDVNQEKYYKPLVSEEIFNMARVERKKRQKIGKASFSKALLVGVLRCKEHKCTMVGHQRPKDYKKGVSKYTCSYRHTGRVKECPNAEITMTIVDDIVVKKIIGFIDDDVIINEYVNNQKEKEIMLLKEKILACENEIVSKSKEQDKIIELYKKDLIDIDKFSEEKKEIDDEKNKINMQIKLHKVELNKAKNLKANVKKIIDIKELYNNYRDNKTQIKNLILSVVDRVEVMQKGIGVNRIYDIDIFFK